MNRLFTWFETTPVGQAYLARGDSDRFIIAVVASLFVLTILWLVAWKPIADWHDDAVSRLSSAGGALDYLKANEALARRVAERGGDQAGSLIPLITRAANTQQLTLNRLQPEANGVLNVILENQSFDRVFQWIAQLEQNNGIRVRRLNIRNTDISGTVNAQIRFQGSG
ncbi:MAG: type II secretion system protein M [Gammaproteobacteria bacterium]|nr:type II secretion system protein M [Gammaproteobacteria bacterium]